MNDSERERIVHEYLSQAMAILEQDSDQAQDVDMEAIARGVGMNDREIAAIQTAAREHFERGRHYREHHQWNEAIDELRVAAAVRPNEVPSLFELAQAYAGRWEARFDSADRDQAERFAKRCIDLDPAQDDCFALLERVRGGAGGGVSTGGGTQVVRVIQGRADALEASAEQVRKSRRVVKTAVASGAAVSLMIGIAVFILTSGNSSSGASSVDRALSLSLVPSRALAGMNLRLDHAKIIAADNTVCVLGDIIPPSDSLGRPGPVTSLKLRLDFIDSSGAVVESDPFTAYQCSKHHDAYSIHRDNPALKGIAEVRLAAQ